MIDNIISFSIKNKLIIFIFVIALITWGGYSLTQLPIDAVPDITNNQVQVITTAPQLAAQEVEKFITYPVELSMATIQDVVEIRSISRFGISVVTIVFKDKVPILDARQLVGERLKVAQPQIPAGSGNPEIAPITTGLGEIYQYVLHTLPGYESKFSPMELRTLQDWVVKRQLLGTPGVADVSSFGGNLKQYEIAVQPEKLKSLDISLTELFIALQRNNQNTGGAYIDKKPNAYFIRGIGLVTSLEDIQKIVVKTKQGIPVLVRDVADVQLGSAIRYGAMTRNAEGEVVGGIVLMLKGENSSKVINRVKEKIEGIKKGMPEGVTIDPFLDRSKLVNRTISTVSRNLVEGGLIVIFVLVLLLGNFRAGLVVASVIPLAMLFAIAMMNLFGVSGNLMSLGAIDFGLIVDGAVIIVEAIVHRVAFSGRLQEVKKLSQEQMDEEVFQASTKIRKSAAFGEIIILIVYLPILALTGIEGKMFGPMAQTVAFAILGALILSLTYIPMMSSLFLSKKTSHKRNISDAIIDFLHKKYSPVLRHSLNHKGVVLTVSAVLLILSFMIFYRMGGEFIPTLEEGDFAVETRIMPGSSLSQTVETTLKAADILLKNFPEVKEVVAKIGTAEIPTDPMPIESCDLIIVLKNKGEWKSASSRDELAEKMHTALSALPGVEFGFQQPIQMRFNELITGARQDVAIKIFGDDLDVLAEKAKEVSGLIGGIKGVSDIYVEKVTGLPQIIVEYNRDKVAAYGLNIEELNRILRMAFAGEVAGVVYEGEKRFDMVVRLKEDFRKNIDDLKNLYVTLENGNQVPLAEVANISFKEGPMQISRESTRRRVTVGINVRDRDVESMVNEIQATLDEKLKLPVGYFISYGGQFENLIQAKQRLSIAVPVALALILILLYVTFNSFSEALLIFTAIPLSAVGGIFALLIRGMPFSISAGVGFIALFGVAVLNGIVLISYFNQLKQEGITDIRERIIKGTQVRLRPVIITASVASLGFLPMALSNSAGAEVQKPLATVVIGGLITATLLTLIVLPVLYSVFEKNAGKKRGGKIGVNPALLIFLLSTTAFLFPSESFSQGAARKVTLDEAVNEALKNNGSIEVGRYEILVQKAIQGTSFDLPKTNLSFTYGQFNSLYKDNNLTLNQNIAFPGVYINQSKLNREQVVGAERKLVVTGSELKANVKSTYYSLLYFQARHQLLLYQDSLYTNFQRATEVRYRTGESAYLEKITAETQLMEVRSQLTRNNADVLIYEEKLRTLMNANELVSAADSTLAKIIDILPQDSFLVEQNPYVSYLKQQLNIHQAMLRLERSRFFPDLNFGYFNQSLRGVQNINGTDRYFSPTYRFQGIAAGIAVPLWFGAHAARVRAVRLSRQMTIANLEFNKRNMEGQYESFLQQYRKFQNSVNYYETSALPQAELIINNAGKAFSAGQIGYLEYLQSLNTALTIKFNYLDNLNSYNQSVISIELISGGN